MAAHGVGAQAQQLDAALVEVGLEAGKLSQLGGTDGGEVLGVGEQDDPVVTNVLVQVDGTLGGVGLEVGGDGAQAEAARRDMLVSLLSGLSGCLADGKGRGRLGLGCL